MSATLVRDEYLTGLLELPQAPVDPAVFGAIATGPMDPAGALGRDEIDRLLDPVPLPVETGWCTLPDGVGYVSARIELPDVTAEMIDWWFEWHPHDPLRYRIWCPRDHRSISMEQRAESGGKRLWSQTHFPVEDVGTGDEHLRIAFCRPSEIGFSTDGLEDRRIGTIICGYVGDPRRRFTHSPMAHVFLTAGDGLVLRSRFWLGAASMPDGPSLIASPAGRLLNQPAVRRRLVPRGLAHGLADHCAREYTHLASILPDLYERFRKGALS